METMKVINKEKLIESVETTFANHSENPYITLRPMCNNIKEFRIIKTEEGKRSLVLLGMNVYMITYEDFANLLESITEEIDTEKYDAEIYIKELAPNDKKIDNKKWYEYIKNS